MSRRLPDTAPRTRIIDVIPTYKGPHGTLNAYAPIPTELVPEMRRALAFACVKTQTAFLAMILQGWTGLRSYHPNPTAFDDTELGKLRWVKAHSQVCEAVAKAGGLPDLMMAYGNFNHAKVHDIYRHAAQALWGAA